MRNPLRRGRDAHRYAEQVVNILLGEFDLDATSVDLIQRVVAEHRARPQSGLEIIVDHPSVANWRLKADLDDIRKVRLADYRLNATSVSDRERRVNQALAALD